MRCPHCGAETSDMMMNCEWCGAPMAAQVPPGQATGGYYQRVPQAPLTTARKWYDSPLPYVVALVVLLVLFGVAFIFFNHKAKAYPQLVVGGKPTLLDVYTDT